MKTTGLPKLELLLMIICSVYAQNCSDTVGKLNPSLSIASFQETGSRGVFLNIKESAACAGPVMGWRFCYYVHQGLDLTDFQIPVYVGAWQLTTNETVYQLINDSFIQLPISPPGSTQVRFVCQEWILPVDFRFTIEQGTVVGVYFPNKSKAVHVIAEDKHVKPVIYWLKGEIEDVYFIPLDALQVGSFALYVEALMGNDSTNTVLTFTPSIVTIMTTSTPATGSSDVPLWAIYMLTFFGILTLVMAVILCIVVLRHSISCKSKARYDTSPWYEEPLTSQELQDLAKSHTYSSVQSNKFTTSKCKLDQPALKTESECDFYDGANTQQLINVVSKPKSYAVRNPHTSHKDRQFKEQQSENVIKSGKVEDIIVPKLVVEGISSSLQSIKTSSSERQPFHRPREVRPEQSKMDFKRSKTDLDLLVLPDIHNPHSHNTDRDDELLSSGESDYPYVLHSREVLGHSVFRPTKSLPNISEHFVLASLPDRKIQSKQSLTSTIHPQSHPEDDPIYSQPYESWFLTLPRTQFMVDPRGRTNSRDIATRYGLQLMEPSALKVSALKDKVVHSSKASAPPLSHEYAEIPRSWRTKREKPMPLPRKLKKQSSEGSVRLTSPHTSTDNIKRNASDDFTPATACNRTKQ